MRKIRFFSKVILMMIIIMMIMITYICLMLDTELLRSGWPLNCG